MINIYIGDKKHEKRIEYVFNYIFSLLGIEYKIKDNIGRKNEPGEINIIYGREEYDCKENEIFIRQSKKIFNDSYLKPIKYNVKRLSNHVNLMADEEIYIKSESGWVKTNLDIISDIFFLLTRYEEVTFVELSNNERFNRFPAEESILFKENILERPIVNEHIELLWSWIDGMNLGYKRKNVWKENKFAVCISHDVDFLIKYNTKEDIIRSLGKSLIKDKSLVKMNQIFKNYCDSKKDYKKDPFYTFDYIMNLEKKYNLKSSFYYMSGGTSNVDNFYDINDIRVKELMNRMNSNGCEIGYHGSFNSYNDLEQMKYEKEKLDYILDGEEYGCRQHYLRFKVPETWCIQERLGIKYDTTLGFADRAGFRCGTCFPFKPYDIFSDRVLNIWEIPLIVMEGTLCNSFYSAYTPEQGYDKIIELINEVRKYGGVFTLLWHNSFLNKYDSKYEKWIPVYEKTMEYLGQDECQSYTGIELIKYLESLE